MEGYLVKHKMQEYMDRNDIGPSTFAKRLGILPVQSFVHWFKNEKKNLTVEIIAAFEQLTESEDSWE